MKTVDLFENVSWLKPVVVIAPQDFLKDALAKMRARKIHHLLVVKNDEVVGIVSDRDIYEKGLMGNGIQINPVLRVEDVMIAGLPLVDENTEVGEALKLMRHHAASALPATCGGKLTILTESDFLRLLERSLQTKTGATKTDDVSRTDLALANPMVQRVMKLLSDIGI